MCRGVEEESRRRSSSETDDSGGYGGHGAISCELCASRAALYCPADDAYLCRKCDKRVHSANILALRHIRCLLCENCQKLTRRYLAGASPVHVALPARARLRLTGRNSVCNFRGKKNCSMLKRPYLYL